MRIGAEYIGLGAPRIVERCDVSLPRLNPVSRCEFAFVEDCQKLDFPGFSGQPYVP